MLEVDWDDQGERFKPWRSVVAESWNETFKDWPIEGPSATLAFAKHIARLQQSPTAWFETWARSKHVASSDRTYHEVLLLVEALQRFGCYDQLNLGSSAGLETLVRRALIVMEAHDRRGERPNYDLAPYLAGAAASSDPMPRDLRSWAARRAKDKAETQRYRTRARGQAEEAREEESSSEAGAEAEGGRGGGRGRGEGAGGRGRGGGRRQAKLCSGAPTTSKPSRVGVEATDAPRGFGLNRRGSRAAGRTGTASLRPGQRHAEENWQTCRVATPPA